MTIGNNVGIFLWNIAEQKEGFKFGKPWRQSKQSLGLVVPILREKDVKRKYKMIEETKNITIEDTGSIDKVRIINKGDERVFIRSGVILTSDASQERVTVSGVIIQPNSEQEVEVKCVHASKGIRSGTKMKATNYAPPVVLSALYARDERGNVNQGRVWDSVQKYSMKSRNACFTSRMGSGGPIIGARMRDRTSRRIGAIKSLDAMEQPTIAESDDLISTIDEVETSKKSIEGAIKEMPVMENQVGAIIFDSVGIVGFEVFDSEKSWKALHKKVLAKYSDILQKKQEEPLFQLNKDIIPEKIRDFIEKIMESNEKEIYSSKESTTKIIDGVKVVGEYTEINGEIIHVIAFKRQ